LRYESERLKKIKMKSIKITYLTNIRVAFNTKTLTLLTKTSNSDTCQKFSFGLPLFVIIIDTKKKC